MSEKITVIVVDDHSVVREGVRGFLSLQTDIEVLAEAGSGETAVALCSEHAPDVVLLDLMMPGMSGIETAKRIKEVSPRSNIVVLTSFHENEHIFTAVKAGALSYLLKDVSPPELADAVRKAARGEVVLHPHVAAQIINDIMGEKEHKASVVGAPPSAGRQGLGQLSKRELEVLNLIAAGLSNAAIAEQLFISERTVKSHVSNILSKLHLSGRTQAALYAWQNQISLIDTQLKFKHK